MMRRARAFFFCGLAMGIYIGATIVIECADGLLNLSDLADVARREAGR